MPTCRSVFVRGRPAWTHPTRLHHLANSAWEPISRRPRPHRRGTRQPGDDIRLAGVPTLQEAGTRPGTRTSGDRQRCERQPTCRLPGVSARRCDHPPGSASTPAFLMHHDGSGSSADSALRPRPPRPAPPCAARSPASALRSNAREPRRTARRRPAARFQGSARPPRCCRSANAPSARRVSVGRSAPRLVRPAPSTAEKPSASHGADL